MDLNLRRRLFITLLATSALLVGFTSQSTAQNTAQSNDQEASQESSPTGTFKTLEAEHGKVWRTWRQETRGAKAASEEERAAHEAANPTLLYISKFQERAKQHQGTVQAIDYLNWLFSWGWRHDRNASMAALDQLLRDHIDSPRMGRLAFSLALKAARSGFPLQKALDTHDLIASKAKTPTDKAATLYWRAYVISETNTQGAERERATRDLAAAIKTGDARTKQDATGLLFKMTRLQDGMVAPEIEGEDLDGSTFKLSDYRGKVVFLDFWGDW